MSNLYDDLLKLQRIPQAYENWTRYREALSDFIVSETESGTTALIVGAGACGDFDLPRLCGHFSALWLLDRDDAAVREGIARQHADIPEERILHADLLGVPDEAYRAIADDMLALIRAGNAADRFSQRLEDALIRALENRRPDSLLRREGLADTVICCGVHSQLTTVFLQMTSVYSRYVPIRPDAIERLLRERIPGIVSDLNDALLRWAKRTVILGLEERRIGAESGIDGAWQAMRDFERRELAIRAQTRLVWPFDPAQNKAYTMRITVAEKPIPHAPNV